MSRRVVLLSSGTAFTSDVLAGLARRGAAVHAVLVYAPPRPPGVAALLRWVAGRVRLRAARRLRVGTGRVVFTGELNGARMVRDLERLAPDVLVLAHCGLVRPNVLSIPREGTVNVHAALLPWVRGNSPLANSLLREIPLGSTAFRVDEGIDTGRILARRLLPVAGGESVAALRAALHRVWVEMTVDLAVAAAAAPLPPGRPHARRLPLCRTVSDADADVGLRVGRGDAKALFERWRPLCDASLSLPDDADPA
jgi:methionyl-tRNA formyltransferase